MRIYIFCLKLAEIPEFDVTLVNSRFGRKQQETKMATQDRSPSLFLGQSWASWADKVPITDGNGNFIILFHDPYTPRTPSCRFSDTCCVLYCNVRFVLPGVD